MSCYGEFMMGIEFNLGSYEFGGRIMVGFMFIWVREHTCIYWLNWFWIGVWMCVFNGVGIQALEGDSGKQPETSNKWREQSL